MTLGHRVAVLRDGLLQQVDTPQYLYEAPVNLFVAGFIGSPAMAGFEPDYGRSRSTSRRWDRAATRGLSAVDPILLRDRDRATVLCRGLDR
jgi:ABC-type sugar transport system ATPase subunit